jgi:ribokinase
VNGAPSPAAKQGGCTVTVLTLLQGANQAATAAKLSYPTYFLGKVGTDSYVQPLRAALADAGVLLQHLQEVPGPSGTAVILLQASGESACKAYVTDIMLNL